MYKHTGNLAFYCLQMQNIKANHGSLVVMVIIWMLLPTSTSTTLKPHHLYPVYRLIRTIFKILRKCTSIAFYLEFSLTWFCILFSLSSWVGLLEVPGCLNPSKGTGTASFSHLPVLDKVEHEGPPLSKQRHLRMEVKLSKFTENIPVSCKIINCM